jgi:Xaa-Pro aminopeptidase
MSIVERLNLLRGLMKKTNMEAYIINGNDPHLSEYVPSRWKTREWISGFTGSYGRVVVTSEKAALWTDSRYFIQAENELKGSGIILMKDRQADTIPYEEWLLREVPEKSFIGVDGMTLSISEEKKISRKLSAKGILLIKDRDLVHEIWKDRPSMPEGEIFDYPLKYAGISRIEKMNMIRRSMVEKEASATLICMLDDLAWTFNIRGNDIEYTPLALGYGYIDSDRSILFIKNNKVPQSLKFSLESENVEIRDYDSIITFLQDLKINSLLIDPDRVNSLFGDLISSNIKVIEGISIPTILKSVKNEQEIRGIKNAHHKDGLAMVKFLHWLYFSLEKEELSELSVSQKLKEFRSEQEDFIEESFYPIVGYKEHGAIVHYHVNTGSNSLIKAEGILLIDSGGQYLDGTTDITRTIALGNAVTEQQQRDFTLVLKGMIQLSKAVFPAHCKGYSLDILARKALWRNHLDYGHGTGHGVGHFLSVHESPVSIRQDFNPYTIKEGNVLSNEPGVYIEGKYGIRTENLLLCRKDNQADLGEFLSFETLTLCPIDRKLINKKLLEEEEIQWINEYHERIMREIGQNLETEMQNWLKIQCSSL